MTNCLYLTNGDSALNIMRDAGVLDEVLPWRDVLHDGPVPGGMALEELSEVRAKFLNSVSMGSLDLLRDSFHVRDTLIARASEFDEIILWFEHDLYDQLQILQILSYLKSIGVNNQAGLHTQVSMICIDQFPGIEPFYGLGQLNADQMKTLVGSQLTVSPQQFDLAFLAWRAFTDSSPLGLLEILQLDTSALPFLKSAVRRFLQEYPAIYNGLSRTEEQILRLVDEGVEKPYRLFAANQELEEAVYLGDWSYWQYIYGLCNGGSPLLSIMSGGEFVFPPQENDREKFRNQRLTLTDTGRAVLAGEAHWLELHEIDKWLGGVHCHKDRSLFCWDESRQLLERYQA